MTQQNLQQGPRRDFGESSWPAPVARPVGRPQPGSDVVEDELGGLFESSPASTVHTSAAAVVAFLAGLVSALAVAFPLMVAVCIGLAVVGVVTSIVGLAKAHRPDTAGTLLASMGLVLSLATLALVGVRYAGIDTTVDASVVSTLRDWLTSLNELVPEP